MTEVWDEDKCRSWLNKEVLSGKSSLDDFRQRLIVWHCQVYADSGNPPVVDWADKSLETMNAVIKEMGLDAPKKRTLFSKLKEEAK